MPYRIVFPKPGVTELQHFDLPELAANDVRVRTRYSLMSIGTETIILHQRYDPDTHFAQMFSFPQLKTGVQAVGTVEERGDDVEEFEVGDTVYMRAAHGSHQQLSADDLSPVPGTVDLKPACWCGLAKTAFRGFWAAQLSAEDHVLVIGAGPVGQMATRWVSAAAPASITVADLSEFRLSHAANGGADTTLCGDIASHLEAARSIDAGVGPSVVIDTTGNAATFQYALAVAGKFGRIILLGDTGYPNQQHLTSDMMTKGLTVKATHESHDRDGWTQRRVDAHFFELLESGQFALDGLITHEFEPSDCKAAYQLADENRGSAMGILFDWTQM